MKNFILFHQTIPIAYECFVVEPDGVIIDRYAAFEQDYRKWPSGIVVLFKDLEKIFSEKRFRDLVRNKSGVFQT